MSYGTIQKGYSPIRSGEVFSEEGRIVCGCFAHDYRYYKGFRKSISRIIRESEVIIDKFTSLFNKKRQETLEEKVARFHRKKAVEEAEKKFNNQAVTLKNVLKEINSK